ncbi:ABC transporter permease [Qipengyuania sp. JC766]|uniref:ABC transporter permease n=1 Tax=Qipengyuania sp. JC766 TaxID=3232139 RepID=UPI003458A8F7
MIALLRSEIAKLRGSLILLLVLVPPLLPGLLIFLAVATNEGAPSWAQLIGQLTMPLWAMFLNAMLLATLATLMGQVEYRTNGWAFVLVQPVPRWQVFVTKLMILVVLHVAMIAMCILGAIVSALAAGYAFDRVPTGDTPLRPALDFVLAMTGGSFAILVLQLWAALRWNNFTVPLAMGIGGTLVGLAVLIAGTEQADWFPWVLALKAGVADSPRWFITTGLVAGIVAAVAMVLDFQRHTFR